MMESETAQSSPWSHLSAPLRIMNNRHHAAALVGTVSVLTCRVLTTLFALQLVSSHALAAQSLNIDIGSTATGLAVPSSVFGAATGSRGVWNAIDAAAMENGRERYSSGVLIDTSGALTSARIDFDSMRLGFRAVEHDEPSTQGDDEALLDDAFRVRGPHTMTVRGLNPGIYRLYVYAMAPDSPLEFTTVEVPGSPDPVATVGGAFAMGYRPNITHSVHLVAAGPLVGDLVIEIDFTGHFDSVAGLQLVHIPLRLPEHWYVLLPGDDQLDGPSVFPRHSRPLFRDIELR